MNADAVRSLLLMIQGYYSVVHAPAEIAVWQQQLVPHEYEDALMAVELWITAENQFPPRVIDLLPVVRRQRWERTQQDAHGVLFCDGSRWIEHDGGMKKPCPNCNPILYQVWLEPDNWNRYLSGTTLDLLHDAVRMVQGKLVIDGPLPDACKTEVYRDPAANTFLPRSKGKNIAWRAYVEDCEENDKIPNRDYFEATIGAVIDDD